ncbi:MAG: hypothetical protein ACKO1M_14605, partial [Planctomycetota bacterium]
MRRSLDYRMAERAADCRAAFALFFRRPSMLDREEYIEQAYLFRSFGERIVAGVAAQEALAAIGQEVL